MKTLSIVNQKGGVGKTSVAINLSYELWKKNNCVLMIDLDPQCDLTDFYFNYISPEEKEATKDVLDLLENLATPEEATCEIREGLYLIPGSRGLATFKNSFSQEVLKNVLKNEIFSEITHVIIDFPPTMSESTLTGLVASQEVLIIVEPEEFSIKNLKDLKENITEIKEQMNPLLNIGGIIVNKVDQRRRGALFQIERIALKHPETLKNYHSVDSCFPRSLKEKKPISELRYYPRVLTQLHNVMEELKEMEVL